MRKLLPFLTICLILIGLAGSTFIPQTYASFFIVQGTHIAFHSQADLIMGVDFTFDVDTFTYGNGSVNIGDTWLNSTCDMTLTAFNSGNWVNYTVSGAGTQQICNGSKPTEVWIDGVNVAENSGWTYLTGITTVTLATVNVNVNFGTSETDESRGGRSSSVIEIGFLVLLKNAPVEGAQIMLLDVDSNMTLYTMYSDGTGLASTTLKPQKYWLKCEYAEYNVLKKLEIENKPNQIIRINLDEDEISQLQVSLSLVGIIVVVLACIGVVYARSKR